MSKSKRNTLVIMAYVTAEARQDLLDTVADAIDELAVGFAELRGLPTRTWAPAEPGHPSQGVKGFLETAVAAVDECDAALADLQDTMLPVEVGDPELRAGLAEVRELVGHLRGNARELVRTLGR